MNSRTVLTPFILSIMLIPFAFAISLGLSSDATPERIILTLFAETVVVEILALFQVANARKLFSRSDQGYLTWTLILAFLIVRLLAEARLTTMNFGWVPQYEEDAPSSLIFFYRYVLRYLYTVSDLLFISALVTTIRSYKSTGLKFELMKQDYLYIILLWAMPVITFVFRENLFSASTGNDPYIPTYRLVAVTVGAIIASLCIVVRRYAVQMGGGAVASVWNSVVAAGIARDASFLALALITPSSRVGAQFLEQYLLWIFACCWLMAALYQREVLPRGKTGSFAAYNAE
ncbi:MAG: hypothetical protein AB1631_33920 [Acidobacteriota bacterium]